MIETSTFGAAFCAMKTVVEMIEALRYKLRMFGIPLDGPAGIFCDNKAVYKNTLIPESVLSRSTIALPIIEVGRLLPHKQYILPKRGLIIICQI